MIISTLEYFFLFVSSFSLVGILTPLMRRIAISKNIMDRPNFAHKSHSTPIPYLGGVAIIVGVVIVTYCALIISNTGAINFWLATSVLAPAVAVGVVGLWDDIRNLRPLPRFIGQSIAGVFVASFLILTETLGNPTGSTPLDIAITTLWVVTICNSINFFDNLDGGAAGTVVISASAISILTLSSGQSFVAALSLVLAGATIGFLIWNKPPARIYMGDAGSLFLGVLIATLTVRLNPETDSKITSFAIPILLLAIPILDTTVAVASRLRRRVSPFQGGKDHLSHRLVRSGISSKTTAIILWTLSVIFAAIAIIISFKLFKSEFVILSIGAIFWIFLLVTFLSRADS